MSAADLRINWFYEHLINLDQREISHRTSANGDTLRDDIERFSAAGGFFHHESSERKGRGAPTRQQ